MEVVHFELIDSLSENFKLGNLFFTYSLRVHLTGLSIRPICLSFLGQLLTGRAFRRALKQNSLEKGSLAEIPTMLLHLQAPPPTPSTNRLKLFVPISTLSTCSYLF